MSMSVLLCVVRFYRYSFTSCPFFVLTIPFSVALLPFPLRLFFFLFHSLLCVFLGYYSILGSLFLSPLIVVSLLWLLLHVSEVLSLDVVCFFFCLNFSLLNIVFAHHIICSHPRSALT